MDKLVVINLGNGDLLSGFPYVTAQLWTTGFSLPEKFVGSLPPAPNLVELYQNWQLIYRCLCNRQSLRSSALIEDDTIEVYEAGPTNVSQVSFDELCQQLCIDLNAWFASKDFLRVERQLRSHLHLSEDVRIILETNDEWLRRLPFDQWELLQDYPRASIALSKPEYKRRPSLQAISPRQTIRILAILGNSQGIDLEAEAQFLRGLWDAETTFLINPSRQEFNTQLWSKLGWDILFFAGHSQTEGQTGRLYINENPVNNSITIEQLEEALKAAIDRGLKLAIFNSCDGLGLASALERLNIPVTVVMREPVPNRVAQEFFKYFLEAFAIDHLPFYQAIRQSCRRLQGLEDEFPGASWLPVMCQNPATEPPTWLQISHILRSPAQEERATELADQSIPLTQNIKQPNTPLGANHQPNLKLTIEQYFEIEKILTAFIGPVASTLLQNFAGQAHSFQDLVEHLSTYLSPWQANQFKQQAVTLFQKSTASLQMRQNFTSSPPVLTDAFIRQCGYALAEAVGPIASFLIQNTLADSPQLSQSELIEVLSTWITDPQKQAEFKQRF